MHDARDVRARVAAADLIVGADCPGCGRAALGLCHACGRSCPPIARRVRPSHPCTVPILAGQDYDGIVRSTVVAWKEHGHDRLSAVLAHYLVAAVLECVEREVGGETCIDLVPIPASRAARRARGRDLVADLAGRTSRILGEVGVDARVARRLSWCRRAASQKSLAAADRPGNVRGALTAVGPDAGRALIVVDDVVTTGSTVAEAVRALGRRGETVSGIACVAATPAPDRSKLWS